MFISFFRHEISELLLPIAMKLCHMIGKLVRFIMQVPKFGGPNPKNFAPEKLFQSIFYNFRLWSRISPERIDISNRSIWKKNWSTTTPSTLGVGVVYPHKTFQDHVPRETVDNVSTIFGGPAPKKLGGPKKSKFWRDFWPGPSTEGGWRQIVSKLGQGGSLPPPCAGKINPRTLYHRVVK